MVATSQAIRDAGERARERHLDRILRRHDRKGELRAAILGVTPLEFRDMLKRRPFDEILKNHGFKSHDEFRVAMMGKLRAELLQRGWSRRKIENALLPQPGFAV